jgi:flagellar motor switch protein FliN
MDEKNDLKTPEEEILAGPPPEEDKPPEENHPDMLSQEGIDNALNDLANPETISHEGKRKERPVVNKADFQQLSISGEGKTPQNIELLLDVDLPVSIELGRAKMSISDLLALGPGSVVELDKLVGEPVDLLVNQKCVARGEVVVVEENFGLRITQLISPEDRIKNLQ